MNNKYERIGEMLKALGHPVRLRIIEGLIKNECHVSKIQRSLGLPQSTVSQHLRVLRNAGIIRGRREGTKMCYRVLGNWLKKVVRIIEKE